MMRSDACAPTSMSPSTGGSRYLPPDCDVTRLATRGEAPRARARRHRTSTSSGVAVHGPL